MKVLVSACIMGENCKYNGKNNKNSAAIHFLKDKEVISICPEVLAGMEYPWQGGHLGNQAIFS